MNRDILTLIETSLRSATINDSDEGLQIWSIFSREGLQDREDELKGVTLFYWDYLQCLVLVFREVVLFLEEDPFKVIAHLELGKRIT